MIASCMFVHGYVFEEELSKVTGYEIGDCD
jgi:hypothetical protein